MWLESGSANGARPEYPGVRREEGGPADRLGRQTDGGGEGKENDAGGRSLSGKKGSGAGGSQGRGYGGDEVEYGTSGVKPVFGPQVWGMSTSFSSVGEISL